MGARLMGEGTLPLAGWKVLDLGIITAGAATSALLADAGAEVVKIESARYPDPFRLWTSEAGGPNDGDGSPVFRFTNRNKRGLALDLKRPEGRALFLRLVRDSDVVVENFRRGVLANLGVDYAQLRAANPRIVLASISSQGETGPDRSYVSYGSTLEATGGIAAITGYPDGPPTVTGRDLNYPDQVVSVFALGTVIAAVLNARRTGEGAHLDIAQREVVAYLIGETVGAASRGAPASAPRQGCADPAGRPQGCFRSADQRWIAVTLQSPEAERAAAALLGEPATLEALERWIGLASAESAIAALRAAGVAAAPVLGGHEALQSQRAGRGRALAATPDGELVKGFPFQSRQTPFSIRGAAPGVGRDTAEVLSELFGLTPAEIARLQDLGVAS